MKLRLLLSCCAVTLSASVAHASSYVMMFESDADRGPNLELAFQTYATFDDLLANVTTGPAVFSPINVNPFFSTTGLAFDGTRYIKMFESDADRAEGQELAFQTYASFDDLLANVTTGPAVFSPINVNPFFSTRGLMFTGPLAPPPPAVIPLPAAGWLLLSALGGIALTRRRRTA